MNTSTASVNMPGLGLRANVESHSYDELIHSLTEILKTGQSYSERYVKDQRNASQRRSHRFSKAFLKWREKQFNELLRLYPPANAEERHALWMEVVRASYDLKCADTGKIQINVQQLYSRLA